MPQLLELDALPGALGVDELWDLLGRLEHDQLEFKQSASSLGAVIPAFAMTSGGIVILGVTDDREVVGCPMTQRVLDKVNRVSSDCHVPVQLREIAVEGIALTVVAVPEIRGRIVTTTDGRLLRRIGSSNVPLVGDAMGRFVREREQRSAEDEVLLVADPTDFDLTAVNAALRAEGRRPVRREGLPRALIDLGVANPADPPASVQVLAAAPILFAHDPTRYVGAASVQLVRRTGVGPGPSPVRERVELKQPIATLLDDALAFIAKHTTTYQVVVGTRREAWPEYPTAVLREALLNALAHRDYGLIGSTIDVTIWDDRIEIHSPGSLPGHITLENIRLEHYSRNRKIMRVLKILSLVEEYGEGVDRMFAEMEARLMEPPMYAVTESSVTVTLTNRFLVSIDDQVWLALLGHFELSAAERRLLVLARREDGVTPRLARATLPDVDAEALIHGAAAKGLLVRVGQAGGARYVLSDEVVMRAGATGLEAQVRRRQLLLDELRRRGSLSTPEAAVLLGEDSAVVRLLLKELVLTGAAEARGRTRGRRYYPTPG